MTTRAKADAAWLEFGRMLTFVAGVAHDSAGLGGARAEDWRLVESSLLEVRAALERIAATP